MSRYSRRTDDDDDTCVPAYAHTDTDTDTDTDTAASGIDDSLHSSGTHALEPDKLTQRTRSYTDVVHRESQPEPVYVTLQQQQQKQGLGGSNMLIYATGTSVQSRAALPAPAHQPAAIPTVTVSTTSDTVGSRHGDEWAGTLQAGFVNIVKPKPTPAAATVLTVL